MLSTCIITDLRKTIAHHERTLGCVKGEVAFFHFNAQHPNSTSTGAAFRAILAQLLQSNKEDIAFIDLATLLLEDMGSGQASATDQEIQSIIQVYLGRLGTSFLVFDALDECTDWEDFIETLDRITQYSECRIVILGRPHLSIATVTGAHPFQIYLETQQNLEDMKRYLEPKVEVLYRRGKLPKTLTASDIVNKIANRADSMFLWVVLMIGYLSSPLLTPNH